MPKLNDSGQAAFRGQLAGTSGGLTDNEGLFLGSGGALTQIVRSVQNAPDGNGTFEEFSVPLFSNSGQLGFLAALSGTSGGVTDDIAIFVSDGIEVLQAVREGDAVAGSVVTLINTAEMGFNNQGQISYKAFLQNDNQIINRWTPELHWRTEGDGHWDSGVNWTLGLNPGDVHDVFIDPSTNSFITGSNSDRALRSLTVGGGSGQAMLEMTGAELAASESIYVAPNGVVSGNGQLNSVIFVDGTLAPGNPIGTLDAQGDLRFSSTTQLRIELGGLATDDFDRLRVLGDWLVDGELQVALADDHQPDFDDQYLICEVEGNAIGQFAGLDEFGFVGNLAGVNLHITYLAGDGDDIALFGRVLLGDANFDGQVNLLDVAPFIELVSSGGFHPHSDVNQDGVVNLLDVNDFVALLF